MLHPLVSLWRHPIRVSFYESERLAGLGFTQSSIGYVRRRFSSTDEAFHYLRYWTGQPDARAELKWVLQRSGATLASTHAAGDGWLRSLAGRMAAGAVVVVEEHLGVGRPGRLVAPASTSPGADDIADLPLLTAASPPQAPATATSASAGEIAGPVVLAVSEWPESIAEQVAQAQTFEAAAGEGAPFCEICEAARIEDQEASPSAASEWPQSDDVQLAQAATFEQASQQGAPFCEICERQGARSAAGART